MSVNKLKQHKQYKIFRNLVTTKDRNDAEMWARIKNLLPPQLREQINQRKMYIRTTMEFCSLLKAVANRCDPTKPMGKSIANTKDKELLAAVANLDAFFSEATMASWRLGKPREYSISTTPMKDHDEAILLITALRAGVLE